MRLVTSKYRAKQKYLETLSENSMVEFGSSLNKKGQSQLFILYDTLPAEFIQKAICMKTKDQLLFIGKRDSKTACCS